MARVRAFRPLTLDMSRIAEQKLSKCHGSIGHCNLYNRTDIASNASVNQT